MNTKNYVTQSKYPNIGYNRVPIEGTLNPDLGIKKGFQNQVISEVKKTEGLVRRSTRT